MRFLLHCASAAAFSSCRPLSEPCGSGAAAVEDDGCLILLGGSGIGAGEVRRPEGFKDRPRQPFHQCGLHRHVAGAESRSPWMAVVVGWITSSSSGYGDAQSRGSQSKGLFRRPEGQGRPRAGSPSTTILPFIRVESRRGAVMCLLRVPFPLPAHQTGRAVFPHPAFRQVLSQGARRRHFANAVQHKYARVLIDLIREPSDATPGVLCRLRRKASTRSKTCRSTA